MKPFMRPGADKRHPSSEGWTTRVRQFFRALADMRGLDSARRTWIRQYLGAEEAALFSRMAKMDQGHCVRVAQKALALAQELPEPGLSPQERRILARAALLHDVGKSGTGLGLIARVGVVLFRHRGLRLEADSVASGRIARWLKAHHEHAAVGAAMARRIGIEEPVVALIQNHHEPANGDRLLALLAAADADS